MLYERYAGRLPDALEALAGPAHSFVDLPLHIAWSGLRTYDLDRPRQRMSLYRSVLAEGQREDITCFLNRDLLLALWPTMRTMISRPSATRGRPPSQSLSAGRPAPGE
ncbi:hypothetical protein ACFXDF_31560 [Streptomyces sp. NPDC059426]|uniref:hypothetical protein n=1 Tax=unclassified Streptomyces TaxID=2593676 RepID=UPI00342CAB93